MAREDSGKETPGKSFCMIFLEFITFYFSMVHVHSRVVQWCSGAGP